MPRIANINIPNNKRVEVGLTYIFGIGRSLASKLVKDLNIEHKTRIKDLTEDQLKQIRDYVDKNLKVEGDLRREILLNIKRLKEITSYRGARHSRKLPARGQRTKTNSRTVRGNVRRTMGSGRAKAAAKT